MITKLVLTNFKRHENLAILFGNGMTALRGGNEVGKSSVYHAIVYAFFGARALPLTLAETVTYDKPEGSLKVEMDFVFEGVTYKIIRSKSGAVISNGTVTANGQAEVTKFVERLFGINADAATKLMIASQNGLRGALETGEAVALIEKLANIDLIDKLIGKIQDQLPCGNTANTVAAIEELDSLKEPELNTEDLYPIVQFTEAALKLVEKELQVLVDSDDIDEGFHRTTIARVVAAKQHKETLRISIAGLEEQVKIVPALPVIDLQALKDKQNQSNLNIDKLQAYHAFKGLVQPDLPLTGDFETLNKANSLAIDNCRNSASDYKVALATAKALIITESACGLCGKDISEIAEVIDKNKKLEVEIAGYTSKIAELGLQSMQLKEEAVELQNYMKADRKARDLYAKYHTYLTLDESRYPTKVDWKDLTADLLNLDTTDYNKQIKEAETLFSNYDKAMAVHTERTDRLHKEKSIYYNIDIDQAALDTAEQALRDRDALHLKIHAKQEEMYKSRVAMQDAKHAHDQAVTRYTIAHEQWEKAKASKAVLAKTLKAMQDNNALIKKLREARPIVAARLWTIVLASVSTYFSRIRGENTVIARTSNNFTANGRPVAGLSGSTLDALGLAIRMALGKTFLPSVNFLLLDEPSAGMDDEREAAMLGLLSTVEYDQVVVVTHSQLADSFATAVVQL